MRDFLNGLLNVRVFPNFLMKSGSETKFEVLTPKDKYKINGKKC